MYKETYIRIVVFITSLMLFASAYGQDDKYEEFIIGDKIYKPGCAWFKLASGGSYNILLDTYESSTNLSYSFRVKDSYFQLGYHTSSNVFFTIRSYQKLNDLYISYGFRKETNMSNLSFFAGPSFSYGGHYYDTDSLGRKRYKGFTQLGLIANAEYTRKIFYDLGLGLSIFASYNSSYKVVGIQAHIYFSGAFRGQIN